MYLAKLNTMSGGDPNTQVSMHDVGQMLGMDKTEAGQMAETLFMGGYAELKTLSGGIGITDLGLEELGVSPAEPAVEPHAETLGNKTVLEGPSLETVTRVLTDLKAALPGGGLSYERLDEAFIDIKTLDVHLLSPRPKTAVAREVFRSLGQTLNSQGLAKEKSRLDRLVSNH